MTVYRVFSAADCPRELFHFRYNIYVEELHRPQTYARHDEKTIIDPLDEKGFHAVAFDKDEIVGCVRLNLVRDGGVRPYDAFYEIDRLPMVRQMSASICTRYMVAKPYRHSRTSLELLKLIYRFGIENGADSCYMDTNAPFLSFYKKFGYEALFEKEHPDYGLVTVMRLQVINLELLKAARSPFAPICERFLKQKKKGTRAERVQAASSPTRISRLPA